MHTEAGVDLVCGPDSPLPEGRQRYRLLHHLGAGGQAEVYRGVRLSAGVSSSPVTVKVFRTDARRPLLDQLRSWDKGDAVLMDLNSRGVAGICLRVDGFYGTPPAPPGASSQGEGQIPYQVLDYLPGGTLIERLAGGASASGPARLRGHAVLTTIARTLHTLHHPAEAGDSPVLHMDVKPSNVIVLPDGEVRLIDFTTARYDHVAHITTIAHTPESAGPEAYTGHVGAAYDVHGFGSVAYYLVTGWLPRTDRATLSPAGVPMPPASVRRHPLLDEHPALAAHLLAPLADRPEDRPRTAELPAWIAQLCRLAAALPASVRLVDWTGPNTTRVYDQASAAPAPTRRATAVAPAVMAGGAGRASAAGAGRASAAGAGGAAGPGAAAAAGSSPQPPRITASAPVPVRQPKAVASDRPELAYPALGYPGFGRPLRADERAGKRVDQQTTQRDRQAAGPPPPPPQPEPPVDPARRHRGRQFTKRGAIIAVVCWLIWLITVLIDRTAEAAEPVTGLVVMAVAAVAAYWLTRLAGHLIRTTLDRGPRRGTLIPHLVTTLFLVLCGLAFLSRTPLSPWRIYDFLQTL